MLYCTTYSLRYYILHKLVVYCIVIPLLAATVLPRIDQEQQYNNESPSVLNVRTKVNVDIFQIFIVPSYEAVAINSLDTGWYTHSNIVSVCPAPVLYSALPCSNEWTIIEPSPVEANTRWLVEVTRMLCNPPVAFILMDSKGPF